MSPRLASLGLLLVLLSGLAAVALEPHAPSTLPALPTRTPLFPRFPASQNLTVIPVDFENDTKRITATSLQGLVNARAARIFLEPDPPSEIDARLLDILRTRHNATTITASLDSAIRMFATEIAGLIVYDPSVAESVNVGTTLSGIRRGLLVGPEQASVYGPAYGLAVIEDLREPPWRGLEGTGLYRAALSRLLPSADASVLGYLRPDRHGPRDYLIASRSFVFYADAGPLADSDQVALLREVLAATPPNAAMLGWVRLTTGAEENFLLQETSRSGKIFVGGEEVPNLSLLSAFPPAQPLRQRRPDGPPVLEDKMYVSFAIPDGDNLDFVRRRMYDLWRDPIRSSLPVAWSISPALAEVAPVYLELLYAEGTPNDTFIAGPSGVGYIDPGLFPESALPAFLSETANAMQAADLRVAWLLNTYRGYEVPYPESVLAVYSNTVRPDGLLLDYGDRPTGPSYWMVGDTPATRSVHYWSSLENLQEKVRLDLESVHRPHFLVVTLYPFTKDLSALAGAADAITALAPGRTEFVTIEQLFSLLLRAFPRWAGETAAAMAGDPLARLLAGASVREGTVALEASRAAEARGDYRTAATEGYRAVQRFHEASAASTLAVLVLIPAIGIGLALFSRRAGIRRLDRSKTRARLSSGIVTTSLTALLVSGTIRVLDANFWDLLAVVGAMIAVAVVWGVPWRKRLSGSAEWVVTAVALAIGVGSLGWSTYGLIPTSIGAALLAGRVRRSGTSEETVWIVSVGFGGLIGLLSGGNPWTGIVFLSVSVFGSLSLPWVVNSLGGPKARASWGRSIPSLLSALPLAAVLIPWTAFFSVRLDWNTGLLVPAAVIVLGLAPCLGAAFATSGRRAWPHLAAAAVLFFIGAELIGGLALLVAVLLGVAFLAAWYVSLHWSELKVPPHEGVAFVGLVIAFVTLARLQPVYYSVYVRPGPAAMEYALYHPLVLVALVAGVAALLIPLIGRGSR